MDEGYQHILGTHPHMHVICVNMSVWLQEILQNRIQGCGTGV